MNISDAGLSLIGAFEGFSGVLYDDPVGHATIAYGFLVHLGAYHRQRGVCALCDRWPRPGEQPLTAEQGRALLRQTVQSYADAVRQFTRVPLNQNQFDALTSLTYNIGVGGYRDSSVRRAVNGGGDVCAELRKYVRGTDGITYPGLVRRREAECQLFNQAPPQQEDDDVSAEQYDELKKAQAQLTTDIQNTFRLAMTARDTAFALAPPLFELVQGETLDDAAVAALRAEVERLKARDAQQTVQLRKLAEQVRAGE